MTKNGEGENYSICGAVKQKIHKKILKMRRKNACIMSGDDI